MLVNTRSLPVSCLGQTLTFLGANGGVKHFSPLGQCSRNSQLYEHLTSHTFIIPSVLSRILKCETSKKLLEIFKFSPWFAMSANHISTLSVTEGQKSQSVMPSFQSHLVSHLVLSAVTSISTLSLEGFLSFPPLGAQYQFRTLSFFVQFMQQLLNQPLHARLPSLYYILSTLKAVSNHIIFLLRNLK